jgi:hypothetical protein
MFGAYAGCRDGEIVTVRACHVAYRCFGDMVEAERRWRLTLAWRKEFNTDA